MEEEGRRGEGAMSNRNLGVYCRDLPITASDERIFQTFSQFGRVVRVDNNALKGFCLVYFDSVQARDSVLLEPEIMMDGQVLSVEPMHGSYERGDQEEQRLLQKAGKGGKGGGKGNVAVVFQEAKQMKEDEDQYMESLKERERKREEIRKQKEAELERRTKEREKYEAEQAEKMKSMPQTERPRVQASLDDQPHSVQQRSQHHQHHQHQAHRNLDYNAMPSPGNFEEFVSNVTQLETEEQLQDLESKFETGLLTQEAYEAEKAKLLGVQGPRGVSLSHSAAVAPPPMEPTRSEQPPPRGRGRGRGQPPSQAPPVQPAAVSLPDAQQLALQEELDDLKSKLEAGLISPDALTSRLRELGMGFDGLPPAHPPVTGPSQAVEEVTFVDPSDSSVITFRVTSTQASYAVNNIERPAFSKVEVLSDERGAYLSFEELGTSVPLPTPDIVIRLAPLLTKCGVVHNLPQIISPSELRFFPLQPAAVPQHNLPAQQTGAAPPRGRGRG
eukprot:Sspe_Gene.16145::Locus_5676_Transcript_1_1_Confidence_1.000_Length_1815::g.16145::m.16145